MIAMPAAVRPDDAGTAVSAGGSRPATPGSRPATPGNHHHHQRPTAEQKYKEKHAVKQKHFGAMTATIDRATEKKLVEIGLQEEREGHVLSDKDKERREEMKREYRKTLVILQMNTVSQCA